MGGSVPVVLIPDDDANLRRLLGNVVIFSIGNAVIAMASYNGAAILRLQSVPVDILVQDFQRRGEDSADLTVELCGGISCPPTILLAGTAKDRVARAFQKSEFGMVDLCLEVLCKPNLVGLAGALRGEWLSGSRGIARG